MFYCFVSTPQLFPDSDPVFGHVSKITKTKIYLLFSSVFKFCLAVKTFYVSGLTAYM